MNLFLATLLVTIVCCLLMGLGLLLAGKPLEGGCGKAPPGMSRCAGCPNRNSEQAGNCPNRGENR